METDFCDYLHFHMSWWLFDQYDLISLCPVEALKGFIWTFLCLNATFYRKDNLLNVVFAFFWTGLDHVKPLVHEHCKRLLINLVVVLVCRGERSSVAKALLDFQSVSNIALDRSTSVKGSSNAISEEAAGMDTTEGSAPETDNVQRLVYESLPKSVNVLGKIQKSILSFITSFWRLGMGVS